SVIVPMADSIALVVIFMLVELVREVRKVNSWASASTRRYQRLANILQGTIPTMLYFIPTYANSFLQFAPSLFDVGEGFNRV
ncbi:hypothetical protein PMAYCL1PPCAC_15036, partial [Pristionchus mayeri]